MARFFRKRKWVHYGGNYGGEYSRSRRAEEAEQAGRYPRTRAAKALGITVQEFKALQSFGSYYPSEWHHVGRYAAQVTYYDPDELLARVQERWVEIDTIYSNDNH